MNEIRSMSSSLFSTVVSTLKKNVYLKKIFLKENFEKELIDPSIWTVDKLKRKKRVRICVTNFDDKSKDEYNYRFCFVIL